MNRTELDRHIEREDDDMTDDDTRFDPVRDLVSMDIRNYPSLRDILDAFMAGDRVELEGLRRVVPSIEVGSYTMTEYIDSAIAFLDAHPDEDAPSRKSLYGVDEFDIGSSWIPAVSRSHVYVVTGVTDRYVSLRVGYRNGTWRKGRMTRGDWTFKIRQGAIIPKTDRPEARTDIQGINELLERATDADKRRPYYAYRRIWTNGILSDHPLCRV